MQTIICSIKIRKNVVNICHNKHIFFMRCRLRSPHRVGFVLPKGDNLYISIKFYWPIRSNGVGDTHVNINYQPLPLDDNIVMLVQCQIYLFGHRIRNISKFVFAILCDCRDKIGNFVDIDPTFVHFVQYSQKCVDGIISVRKII